MSQQGMTIVSLVGEDLDMGDLEYIQDKVLAGDYFQVSGDIDALGIKISQVVPNGKTAFLIEAKIVTTGHTSGTTTKNMVEAELKIDGVTVDTTNIGTATTSTLLTSNSDMIAGSGSGTGIVADGKFNVLGISLVGDGAKVIEIENTLDNGTAFATMSGYYVDT